MVSNEIKRRGMRVVLGAVALGAVAVGISAGPAMADDWRRDGGGRHYGWDRGHDHGWDRDGWRRHEWREHRPYGYGYYAPPRVYYEQPRVYYPPEPQPYYGPQAYYPGSFNITIPIR